MSIIKKYFARKNEKYYIYKNKDKSIITHN